MRTPEPEKDAGSAACALDTSALNEQLARYARLGAHAADVDRSPGRVLVRFGETVDQGLLDHTLAVEGRCCPSLATSIDAGGRQLTISVKSVEEEPLLDPIFDALTRARGPLS